MFVIRSPRRDQLQAHLAQAGIWTSLAYVPSLHLQPAYRHLVYGPGSFPQTERVAEEFPCLPAVPELSGDKVRWVAETARSFFEVAPTQR
jgi:aminotransferase EvaB